MNDSIFYNTESIPDNTGYNKAIRQLSIWRWQDILCVVSSTLYEN